MSVTQIIEEADGEFTVILPAGWTTTARTRAEAEALVAETTPAKQDRQVAYAGGTRYHLPVKLLRRSDNLVKTACGQRGWISENPAGLAPCQKCF